MRLLSGLAALLVLAGCGTVAGRSRAPAAPLSAAPPIEAVDEAPPEEVQRMLDLELAPLPADFGASASAGHTGFRYTWSSGTVSSGVDSWGATGTTPTAAQLEQVRAELEAQRAALRPAAGSAPRVVAKLALPAGGRALFVVWRNRDRLLCTDTEVADAHGGGGGGPGGPCALAAAGGREVVHCAAICLASAGGGTDGSMRWVLSGTVALDADALRVTTADGATATYPLTGPVLEGGERRVFMLDLGSYDWRTLALLRGGQVVDQTALPAAAAAAEDCDAEVGPMPPPAVPPAPGAVEPSPELEAYGAAFNACLAASGAYPSPPAPPVGSAP